jgi:hypothetical protein
MTNYDLRLSFYGSNKDAIECQDAEVLLIGPAETGKTLAFLWKLHRTATKYEKASLVILRKTLTSTYSTVLVTFQEKVIGKHEAITIQEGDPEKPIPTDSWGGEKPQWFDYPNGSRIWVAGLDKSSRILSAEHDLIYVNQTEELTLDDWETLTTRTTGRAGHVKHPQTIGDANPTYPTHWMYQRQGITRFYSWHKDNPVLYDPATGEITEQGKRTISRLDALTGLRKERLRWGRAVQAEGAVYDEYNTAVHLVDRFDIPDDWRRIRSVDFGYTNPFVCQWWAMDNDGRMYLYREIYKTQTIVEDHARQIVELSNGESIEATVCDHDAEDRATLERHGVPTVAADKAISVGIQNVQKRLTKAGDNRPRLFIMRDSLVSEDKELAKEYKPICTEHEFPAYIWPKSTSGKPVKEVPVDLNNHGMDALRYAVMYLDGSGPSAGETVDVPAADYRRERRSVVWNR